MKLLTVLLALSLSACSTFKLNQDSHILSELLSPIDCAVNVIICKVSDEVAKWFDDSNAGNPEWSIRADLLSDAKHPLVMCSPRLSKFGASVDSSLSDCIRIGNQARAPPISQSNLNSDNNNNPSQPTNVNEILAGVLTSSQPLFTEGNFFTLTY